VIGVSVWFALDPEAWRSFEDRHGPIRAVLNFVLVAAIAVLVPLQATFARVTMRRSRSS